VTGERAVGDLTLTDVAKNATDGKTPTAEVTVHGVVSSCAPDSLLLSFPSAAAGEAGLGRGSLGLPAQLYAKLSLTKRQFAICLPSTAAEPGVAFFGSGPYGLMPPTQFDAGAALSYTDLVRDPRRPTAYGIRLRGIAVNQEAVPLPAGALGRGGGVTLDTALPYTVNLRRDVYRPLVDAFRRATALVLRAPSVPPFELCFDSGALGFTRVGYAVAPVDLMMARGAATGRCSEPTRWRRWRLTWRAWRSSTAGGRRRAPWPSAGSRWRTISCCSTRPRPGSGSVARCCSSGPPAATSTSRELNH
jgi:hypothetical protein